MPHRTAQQTDTPLARLVRDEAELTGISFDEPWSARLFALTLAAAEAGIFTIGEFQSAMIEAVGRHEANAEISNNRTYYERWIEALVGLLGKKRLVDGTSLHQAEERLLAALAAMHRHGPRAVPVPLRVQRP